MLRARDNPFSSDRVLRERYRFDEAAWSRLRERLARQNGRGALVGACGTGKTTLLEDLAQRLAGAGTRVTFLRLSAESPNLPASCDHSFFQRLGASDAVLLDGAEQLSWMRWIAFRWRTRQVGTLVITSHHHGRLPLLHPCTTTPDLLAELSAALGEPLSETAAASLHREHRGNLREALRALYDECAQRSSLPNARSSV